MSPSVSIRLLLTQSDSRLVEFAHAGHERAFEALVARYRRPLLAYCRRLLLSQERAEDALQQALLQAWLALQGGVEVEDVKPWLYRIVHNTALNALRASRYDYAQLNESLSGEGAPQEDLDRRIAVREALAGLAALPQMQREALLRTAVDGGTHREVAHELGLSEPALRGLVYRARASLRAASGAIVPPPLLTWALEPRSGGTPMLERLAELSAGGSSAGVAGLAMKSGAVALTAGALAGGIVAVHPYPSVGHRHAPASTLRAGAQPATRGVPVAVTSALTAGGPGSLGEQATLHHQTPSGASRLRPEQGAHSPKRPFTTKIAPADSGGASGVGSKRSQQQDGNNGGGGQDGAGAPHSPTATTGTGSGQSAGGDEGGSSGGGRNGPGQQNPADSSGQDTRDGGAAPGASSSDGHDNTGQDTPGGPSEGASQIGASTQHEQSPSQSDGAGKDLAEEQGEGAESESVK